MKDRWFISVIIGIILFLFLYCENNFLSITKLTVHSKRLPAPFDGFKILHLSDLHGKSFGLNQNRLFRIIRELKPDIILFTGDLIDRYHYRETNGLILLNRAQSVAPVFFVNGNHERLSGRSELLNAKISALGIHPLTDIMFIYQKAGSRICLLGIDDPASLKNRTPCANIVKNNIEKAGRGIPAEDFKIVLAHRPEFFKTYADSRFDLIFAGHAHGGQIRLPFVGGLYTPDQGFFPKYTSGLYVMAGSQMIVSRGLGNTVFAPRLFNRPEVLLITLRKS